MNIASKRYASQGDFSRRAIPSVDLRLRRCRAIGCENLATPGGYCLRCAEELVGLQQMEARKAARARIKNEERPREPRSNRSADLKENLAFLGVVVLLAGFVWVTRAWWMEGMRIWGLLK